MRNAALGELPQGGVFVQAQRMKRCVFCAKLTVCSGIWNNSCASRRKCPLAGNWVCRNVDFVIE